ncbi:MAG: RNA-binding cell elongation regulator Jag/EloR [Oscillospiraceae bacterium]|nr:RNA-binding cell elongation regulator Jag/EloR [Oscillospiraceae bacterium]
MKKEFTAKTVEEAKELAAAEFGVSADEIDFDILEQPRKGLFGMKGSARVMASYEAPVAPEAPTAPAEEVSAEEPAPASFEDENEGEEVPELPEDFDIENSAKVQTAKKYLTDVLHALGLENFEINAIRREGNIVLDITGEKLGVVIGRRGETLDSLQYLTILASNRTEESYCRISIDCNGYRDKRRETLESLAKRTSAKVIKQGRKIALEPMNPYERRIIHSCVAEIEGVSSHSTGVEPYRKVVIYADKPKFDNRRSRRGDRGERRGNGNTRNYRQSTGFSTSFEREYKRRTYEPDENADAGEFSKETVDTEKNAALYGKIEL